MKILFVNTADTSRHVSSANTAIYPNLGILTLMSSLRKTIRPGIELGYLDGTVYGNPFIQMYIEENAQSISMICFSVLTANYGAAIVLANLARALNPSIVTIFGNDHFSALYETLNYEMPKPPKITPISKTRSGIVVDCPLRFLFFLNIKNKETQIIRAKT